MRMRTFPAQGAVMTPNLWVRSTHLQKVDSGNQPTKQTKKKKNAISAICSCLLRNQSHVVLIKN